MDPHRSLGFLLKDVTRLYTRRFEERAASLSLTLQQCKALIYLEDHAGISQKRLAELIEVDPMSLVRILDRMEADGWVERRPDPLDRRARSLHLTERAGPILRHIRELIQRTRAEALSGLDEKECAQLLGLLERVHRGLLALGPLAASDTAAHAGAAGTADPARAGGGR